MTTYRISRSSPPQHDQLAALWRELETRSDGSFFTSWHWIGPWLACLPEDCHPQLVQAHRGNLLVGLALVVPRPQRRFGFLPLNLLHLHETGRTDCDALTIEYNGCLADREDAAGIARAMYCALMEGPAAPDELRLFGITELPTDLPATLQWRSTPHLTYYVDLAQINASGKDYLGFLKQRQRYLVRKNIKRLSDPLPLRLVPATTQAEASHYLCEMERLHTRYWNAKGEPGAFGSEFQRAFHRTIVERGITSGAVVLLAALRGEQAIGYFYFYCHRDWAHYYQSGIDYEQLEGSESPGLAAHALAIEYFRAAGYRIYDFMTGDLQYKRTLATHDMPLHWMVLQQNTPKMRLEVWLLQQAKRARAQWWRTRDAWQQRQAAARAPIAAEAQPSEAKANETKTNEASPG